MMRVIRGVAATPRIPSPVDQDRAVTKLEQACAGRVHEVGADIDRDHNGLVARLTAGRAGKGRAAFVAGPTTTPAPPGRHAPDEPDADPTAATPAADGSSSAGGRPRRTDQRKPRRGGSERVWPPGPSDFPFGLRDFRCQKRAFQGNWPSASANAPVHHHGFAPHPSANRSHSGLDLLASPGD